MKQDPRTIIDINQDHTFNKPADKKVKARTLATKFNLVWKADKLDTRDYKYQVTQKINPNLVDLRNYCSPIENQGSLGSCTGQSIAGAIELLNKRNGKPTDVSRLFIYYYERLPKRTVELLVQYFFLKIFIKYIDLSQDPKNIFHKEEEAERQDKEDERDARNDEDEEDEEEEEYELETRDDEIMIRGNQKKLRGKVSELLIVYINIMAHHKKDNDISYEEVSDMVFKIKQREKNTFTDKLKEKDDEGRNIDNLFKKYKLGDWNKGLQKGLTEYVAEDYDNAMEERDANQQYENDLRNNPRHGNNYDEGDDLEDNLEQLQIDREIEDENADLSAMDDDFTDGRDPYFGNADDEIDQTDEY